MRTSLSQYGRIAAVALPLVAGCVSATPGPGTPRRMNYAPEAFARIRDSLITGKLTEAAGADQPRVRIIPPAVRAANYVNATIEVSKDAYVLVVATDLDGQVRVVFPESPTASGFLKGASRYSLPEFFGGFGPRGLSRYGRSAFSVEPVNRYAALGTMVALASDRPLQLSRITRRDGDWDEAALERLVYGRTPNSAGYSLGTELALADNGFHTAYSGFFQSVASAASANASVGASICDSDRADSRGSDNPLNAMYYDGPRTTFFERDGVRYATTITGNPCTGYQTRTVPVGPANPASGAPLALPQQLDTDANRRAQAESERVRAQVQAAERASRPQMTPTAAGPKLEPMRREPPQLREAPAAPAPEPTDASSGKPKKE